MKSVNRVTLLGHIVADLELKSTKTGKPVVSFAIATNNEWFDAEGELKKSADFHRVVAWDHLADLCSKFLQKGSPIYLEGRLTNRSYEGKDNLTHYLTEVVATHVTLLQIAESKKNIEPKTLEAPDTHETAFEKEKELVAA
jgi:single-strand DNA-binding protein